jgi:hypothetical protein
MLFPCVVVKDVVMLLSCCKESWRWSGKINRGSGRRKSTTSDDNNHVIMINARVSKAGAVRGREGGISRTSSKVREGGHNLTSEDFEGFHTTRDR